MSWLEQLAILLVMLVCALFGVVTKWALDRKKIAEIRLANEALRRREMEYRHELEQKTLGDIVRESNKRHGRGE
jgi:cell division protein FtsL